MITFDLLTSWLASATIKGSFLIVLMAAVISISGSRIPPAWRHTLWLIVVVRLLVPVSVQSPLSVFNLSRLASVLSQESASQAAGAKIPPRVSNRELVANPIQNSNPQPGRGVTQFLATAWLLGCGIMGGRIIFCSLRLSHRLPASSSQPDWSASRADRIEEIDTLLDRASRVMRITKPRVVETMTIDTPAIHGVIRPVLLLPKNARESFSSQELYHMFLHELAHLRRRDTLVNCLVSLAQIVHWFNPLVWIAIARMREERELAADTLALSKLSNDEIPDYGRTVIRLLDQFRPQSFSMPSIGMINRKEQMKRRIMMIAGFKNHSRYSLVLFGALTLALGAGVLTDAKADQPKMRTAKPLSAEQKTIMKSLEAPIAFDIQRGTVLDVLTAISSRTGVSFSQSDEVAAKLADLPMLSVKADNMPARLIMNQALSSVHLGFEATDTGVLLTSQPMRIRMAFIPDDASERAVIVEGSNIEWTGTEEGKAVIHEQVTVGNDDAGDSGQKQVFIEKTGPAIHGDNADIMTLHERAREEADGSVVLERTMGTREGSNRRTIRFTSDQTGPGSLEIEVLR